MSDLTETIRKILSDKGMKPEAATAAARAVSSKTKTGTERYMTLLKESELSELWEDLHAEQSECM
jgi:SOS-response transcriptional repressor LexA